MNKLFQTTVCGVVAACALSAPAFAQGRHAIRWSGKVDDVTIVRIQGDRVRAAATAGAAPIDVSTDVNEPLPQAPVHVWLSHVHGRGSVRLVQEPTVDNNFTAVVRISDPQHSRGDYSFELRWRGPQDGDTNNNNDNDNDNDNR